MELVLSIISWPQSGLKRALSPLKLFLCHVYDHFIPHHRNNYHPHILGHRNLALMSGLLVAVKIFTLSLISFGPVAPAFSSAITSENIISLTNQSRQEYGLTSLAENDYLDKAAQVKANDMLERGYFSHNTPDGKTPWTFITNAGYSYLMAGENLAVNFTEAENVEAAWMNSPGHKANILNKNFEEIGIGIAQGQYQGHMAIFVVQMFGTPIEQKVTMAKEHTRVQTSAVPIPNKSIESVKGVETVSQNNAAQPGAEVLAQKPVSVISGESKLEGNMVKISAQVSGPVYKAIAYFDQEAVMLSPKNGGQWVGEFSLSTLTQKKASVKVRVFGTDGQTSQMQLADFTPSTVENYNLSGSTKPVHVTLFNNTFDPKNFEHNFFMMFIAGLLSSLVIAIAVKKHIQHLSLIANSSFVIIFAALLAWAG